ncbi:LamG-like jellyroll fold domain-containing protein [Micromonospora sp. HK10]|uniref:LamG-like jellyroll fold domain-containing protein n=1 Tax=Micromonospora sp. HK10 TaxID=1538294 RepID=UPI000697DC88|nr:LamG-like jellyroll fold domain-containing protein [Micromonospora sp. HK10]
MLIVPTVPPAAGRQRLTRLTAPLGAALLLAAAGWVVWQGPASAPAPAPPTAVADPTSAVATARRLGRPVEIPDLGSPTTEVFANPTGTLRARIHTEPVRVRRGSGWVPVDPTLVTRPDGAVAPAAAAVDLAFSGGGDTPLASIGVDGKRLALRWPRPLPRPRLAANTATYPDVLPEVDLVVHATATGFSEVLVVRTARAARQPALTRLAFDVDTTGLTVRRDPGSGVPIVTDGRGRTVLTLGRAWMWDSAGGNRAVAAPTPSRAQGPARGDRIAPMTVDLTSGRLVVVPDRRMLADPRLTFPIYLDPSLAARRQHWVMVQKDLPTFSWWDSSYDARVGRDPADSTTDRFRSYFEFDTTAFAGKLIKSAVVNYEEKWRYSCTPEPVHLYWTAVVNPATTWSNAPALQPGARLGSVTTPKDAASCSVFTTVDFDITSLMTQIATGGAPHLTVALASDESSGANGGKVFGNVPVLDVEYNTVPRAPTQLSTAGVGGCSSSTDAYVNTRRPAFKVRLEDDDADQSIRGTVEWRKTGATSGSTLDTGPVPRGGEPTATVPEAAALVDGQRYEWRARAYNEFPGGGVDVGPWSDWCRFVVDTVPPATRPGITVDPGDGWLEDRPVAVTFDTGGDADTVEFQYGLNASTLTTVAAVNGRATVRLAPTARDNTLIVKAVDRAGNVSAQATQYQFQAEVLPDPVAHWPMDDWFGDLAMDWAGSNPLSLTGGYEWTDGEDGGALRLDGSSETGGGSDGPVVRTDGSFTVMAWVRLTDTAESRTAVSQAGTRHQGFQLRYDSYTNRWAFVMRSADSDDAAETLALSRGAPLPGVWTHLAGVYDDEAGQLRLYVNGRLNGTAAHHSAWNAEGPFGVGYANWYGFRPTRWVGDIDNVKVFPFAATARKIRLEVPSNRWGTQARWELDEGTGTVAQDSTGEQHTVALTAGASWLPGPGRQGGSGLHLDGVGGQAFTAGPVADTAASFTVAAWVRLDRADSWFTAVSQDGDHDSGFKLQYSAYPRGWMFAVNTDDVAGANPTPVRYALSDNRPQLGVWTHLAGVYDHQRKQLQLYVNGRLAATASFDSARRFEGPLRIGRAANDGWPIEWWPGDVDDVRVAAEAMTPAGITQWMSSSDAYGPTGRWSFDEPSGIVAADSVPRNGNTMSLAGPVSRIAGKRGNALHLAGRSGADEGGSAYTAASVVRTDHSFTVSAWVRLDRLDTSMTAVSQDGRYDSGFTLGYAVATKNWVFVMSKADGPDNDPIALVASAVVPRVGVWTHLAGTYDVLAGQLKLYVNGALAGTTLYDSHRQAGGALQVGRGQWNGLPTDWWAGDIDEVAVDDRPLTAEQVRDLLLTSPMGPGAWWRLDEAAGGEVGDSSGNGHQLVLGGNASWLPVGRCGGALRLGGAGRAAAPQSILRTDTSFTVATWVRLDSATADATAVSQDGTVASGFQLGYQSTQNRWRILLPAADTTSPATVSAVSTSAAAAGGWVHLAGVYDRSAGQLRLYVNGRLEATSAVAATWQADGVLQLGRARVNGKPAQGWSGALDEVRVLQRAATAAEVQEMVDACDDIGPPPVPQEAGPIQVRALHSGLCLAESATSGSGYLYQQASCSAQSPPLTLEPVGDGTYRLTSTHPTRGTGCLGVEYGSTSSGAAVLVSTCGPGRGQIFDVERVSEPLRGYRLRPIHSGLCVGIANNATAPGAQAIQVTCNASAAGQVLAIDPKPAPTSYPNRTYVQIRDQATVESPTSVTGWSGVASGIIQVDVVIRHTYRGDLVLDLVAPSGREFRLKNSGDGSDDDVVASYLVDATGEAFNGTWRLRVQDLYAGDTGYLDSWTLVLVTDPTLSYLVTVRGSLSAGSSGYQPGGDGFYAPAGTRRGSLIGPSGTDFDLYLQRWDGSTWTTVASSTSGGPDETISYPGAAGYYRFRVQAYSGSGSYLLGYDPS